MAHPLSEYRKQAGLTQGELAKRLKVSRQLIGMIEAGERDVTPQKAKQWEMLTGIPRARLCPEVFA